VSKPFLSTTIREAALVERQNSAHGDARDPTVRLRRLGAELKRIREDAGLSLDAAGVRLGRSASSLSKIENGRVVLPRRDLTYILDCYDVTDEPLREMLYALARDGRKKGWWRRYADTLSPAAQDYMSLEADAAAVRTFQPLVVPGLLQSESYARAVIEAGIPLGPRNVDRLLSIRMARQALLSAPSPPQIWLIIWEAVLRHTIGGRGVMAEQLARRLGARSNGGAW
jgi:transcriptional regulator with XRE-family HTH domain